MGTFEPFEVFKARLKAEAFAEGYAKGLAESRAEGEAEGRAEGQAEGFMTSLLQTHAARFGPLPDELRRALEPLVTDDTIASWVLLFATAPSSNEIAAAILRGTTTP